ncbi:Imm49 family immunity protein [Streptomyces sp. NBC_00826]|nr:Imm49 family immunity protein [Streptomyces sp. NBC_00826]
MTSTSQPADLAAVDALCGYLTEASGHLPRDWPTVPLRKPDPVERAEAARRLDAAGHLTPDQQLLRVLLDDDQHTFEQALVTRLVGHLTGSDTSPRTGGSVTSGSPIMLPGADGVEPDLDGLYAGRRVSQVPRCGRCGVVPTRRRRR